ncbi:23S rRNA (uracil(1939)-C(5))-methyltransferase RlmD [Aestuariicella hydrocarbonica]|uniref:23S rRNA (uracil(1939)-C(5))-methyltransferase RlmD n=1 Tax=Pseudomaricurvus hydrocarbonicus TaxID=1470433 RepID=A0A9E5T3C9_9GAMM|nr:23S rRNA (uracil(1939)-C(5))-methyltransferase RlmD [Aestuariicella hydrocarbonica]NHO67053.1 23S rRNA (uracil(1939)-C(5))-methyltransferase RlmD [Aestuariicella hydrocarbonica]
MARLFKPRLFKPLKGKRASSETTPTELYVEDLAHDGRGVARHEGKTVFVAGGLPGERVLVSHYRRQKRFSECEAKTIEQASQHRVEPQCPHFQECGGCQLQHFSADQQIHYKQQALLTLLKRQHKIEPNEVLGPIRSPAYGYRSRVRLGVDRERRLAFREQGSDRLVPIGQCEVLDASLTSIIPLLQAWLTALPEKAGVTHVELISANDEKGRPAPSALIRHVKALPEAALELLEQIPGLRHCWLQAEKNGILSDTRGQPADPCLYLELPGESIKLAFHPQDFTQVNPQVNQAMVAQAMDWLDLTDSDRVVDLFCGIGNFTLPIARRCQKVIGIEGVESMVVRGHENSALNHVAQCEFQALDLDTQALAALLRREQANKLLLDPPRAGAKFVCEQIKDSGVERLVYVSCNPASFSRDAAILVESGFALISLRALDMFPQTAHMETMALFVRVQAATR